MSDPFAAWAGPRNARIVILGEAWGEKEDLTKQPFAGSSGQELFRMLGEAAPDLAPALHSSICSAMPYGARWLDLRGEWLSEASVAFTNTLNFRPPDNKLDSLCVKKGDLANANAALPPLSLGKYLPSELALPELTRLRAELEECAPNLVVLCGNTACWAMLRQTNITAIRGNAAWGTVAGGPRVKCLPTFHPAGVLRQWAWRPIVIADLMKGFRESLSPTISRPEREILVDPTLSEVKEWIDETLANPPALLACDTETAIGQVTMIGFARSRSEALLIPLFDKRFDGASYWPDLATELEVFNQIDRLLSSPIPKVFQNGLYDYQYLIPMGFKLRELQHDTMLRHHSILPEMKKGLGFLASIYTNEPTWKTMRLDKADTEKRDE